MKNFFRRLLFSYWYFGQPPWDTGVSPPELLEFVETHPAGRAIDMGCGTGTNVVTLARAGWMVTGVDFAPRAISLAKTKLRNAHLSADVHVNDVTTLKHVLGPFDLAFDLGCFHTIPQDLRTNYLDQLDRVLASGGFWLLYGFLADGSDPAGPAIGEAEIRGISSRFSLCSRRDGFDNRQRNSAWFLFQK